MIGLWKQDLKTSYRFSAGRGAQKVEVEVEAPTDEDFADNDNREPTDEDIKGEEQAQIHIDDINDEIDEDEADGHVEDEDGVNEQDANSLITTRAHNQRTPRVGPFLATKRLRIGTTKWPDVPHVAESEPGSPEEAKTCFPKTGRKRFSPTWCIGAQRSNRPGWSRHSAERGHNHHQRL